MVLLLLCCCRPPLPTTTTTTTTTLATCESGPHGVVCRIASRRLLGHSVSHGCYRSIEGTRTAGHQADRPDPGSAAATHGVGAAHAFGPDPASDLRRDPRDHVRSTATRGTRSAAVRSAAARGPCAAT